MARAGHCDEAENFISGKVVYRNKLQPLVKRNGTIKLQSPNIPDMSNSLKIPYVRFRVVSDDEVKYDIAFGRGHCGDEDDEDLRAVSEQTQDLSLSAHSRYSCS